MTLVLTCLTRDAIFQVSDRRLTRSAPPFEIVDDEANKAVVVEGRVVFGYTGLARIQTERTDDWLARVIGSESTNDMAQIARRIKDAATQEFVRMNLPAQFKYHAFQGAGWFRLKGEDYLRPGTIVIDNGFDHRTWTALPSPLAEFRVSTSFPEKMRGECVLSSIGFVPSAEEKAAIVRLVRKCVKHRHSTFRTVLHALINSMRWLSSRHWSIGPGLMAVCLPKKCVQILEESGQVMMLAGPPTDYAATFLYVSATGSTTIFGPHFVGDGSIAMNFRARTV